MVSRMSPARGGETTDVIGEKGLVQAVPASEPPGARSRQQRYAEKCYRCGTTVTQESNGFLCDVDTCISEFVVCVGCFPVPTDPLFCPVHAASAVTLAARREGVRSVVATASVPVGAIPSLPVGASPDLAPLFQAVAIVLATVAAAAAIQMERAWRIFLQFLTFYNVRREDVSPYIVMSFALVRCYPPVGCTLPPFAAKSVVPATLAGDLSALRRRARLVKDGSLLASLLDEDVLRLCANLGTRTKRAKTTKKPILLQHIRKLWLETGKGTMAQMRNISLLLVGLLAGLRRRELVALSVSDLRWCEDKKELQVVVRRDKTNQNIVNSQLPRVVSVAHQLLDEIWPAYLTSRGSVLPEDPAFPRIVGSRVTRDFLAPATVATIVKECLPGLGVTPHSLRVGCATELFAAGVSVSTIMEIGRWSSITALLYVLPSSDVTTAATRRIGAGVQVDRILLQRAVGTDTLPLRAQRCG